MKRMIAFLIAALLILTMAACSDQNNTEQSKPTDTTSTKATEAVDTPVDGGWAQSQSIEIDDHTKEMFEQLNATLTGAQYEPIVYVSSQVVAGTNHLVLCKSTPTVPDAATTYVLVTVYEDLQGNVDITSTLECDVTAPAAYDPNNPVAGGYGEPDSYAVTDEAKTAMQKANEADPNVTYEPIALLAMQIVAGKNYQLFCKATLNDSGTSSYIIATVYADLQGNAELTAFSVFTDGSGEEAVEDDASASSQDE